MAGSVADDEVLDKIWDEAVQEGTSKENQTENAGVEDEGRPEMNGTTEEAEIADAEVEEPLLFGRNWFEEGPFLMSDCRWLETSNHLQSDIKKRYKFVNTPRIGKYNTKPSSIFVTKIKDEDIQDATEPIQIEDD